MEGVQMSQINNTVMIEMMRGTPPPTWEQTCLDLDKKLADSRQYVTQLENRLRALWDKLEGERKHYMERIEKLEEAGDAMAERCEVDIENWYRTKKGEL
jgi:hypothetical protein